MQGLYTISFLVWSGSPYLPPLMCDSMTHIYSILAQFSQSTRPLHVESFNPEPIFLLDHPNNNSHPAPYIRRLITFTLGNIHDVRVELTSNMSISHVNIIKYYLQYVHSLVTKLIHQYIYNIQVSQIMNHIISHYGHAHGHVPPTNMFPHLSNRLAVI